MDPTPESKTILSGVKFRHWIGGILVEMRRKSPVQQWVESVTPQGKKPIVRPSAQDDLDLVDESCNIASLKLESESESTTTNRSSSPALNNETLLEEKEKEDSASGCEVEKINSATDEKTKDTNVSIKVSGVVKKENNVNISSDSVKSVKSDESEAQDRVYSYSKSVESGSMIERKKAPLIRDRSINSEGNSPKHRYALRRDSSLQSDPSRASSVESLLEARKVDAEGLLREMGFGPDPNKVNVARIPDRFLQPSKVKGVCTEKFIKDEEKSIKMHECGVFGYKGLTGDPHAPKSTIVTKIIERISSHEEISERIPMPRSRRNTNTY